MANNKANNSILSNDAIDAIKGYVSKSVAASKSLTRVTDALVADGIRATDIEAPKKGAENLVYQEVKVAVVAGFTVAVQNLLAKDVKSLDDAQKTERRYWQMQIGSKLKDIRNSLKRREGQEEQGGAQTPATIEARLVKDCGAWVTRLQKAEDATMPIPDIVKLLQSIIALASK